ncbi:sodium channel modifier 1 isoform X2 [Seriola aureovittata]|nr:sodium channel modifier 1 isoform X2 [Seriola aureovittata]
MKNGRYTCLVCSYRPVFDTVDMLTVHRKGKRHLEGLKSFYGKKARLKNEITKRQHENYIQVEDREQEPSSSAPLLEQTRKLTHHALLKTVPYNSCHRKTSTKSEKGPESISSDPSGNASSKMPSEQEHMRWKSEVSNSVPPSSSSSFTAANKELHPSKDIKGSQLTVAQEAEPITAQRRSELEHYLKLKRYRTVFLFYLFKLAVFLAVNISLFTVHFTFFFFLVMGGYKTAVASGLKTRMLSLIQTRRSLLRVQAYPQVTERTKNCGNTTQINLYHSGTFRSHAAV